MNEADTHISEQLDQDFDNIRFDRNSDEARQHVIKLINHMLAVAYEIKVLINNKYLIFLVEE